MVKIISGWSNPGGSTTAFINLTNLFNENGIPTVFYGPHDWHIDKCNGDMINGFNKNTCKNDTIIAHFLNLNLRMDCKKLIYSCHEQHLMPMDKVKYQLYDTIHYVSEHQRQFHNIDYSHFICPNVLPPLQKNNYISDKIGGIIGSIDPNKQVHISIQKALEDNCKRVYLFGKITDIRYFETYVKPLLEKYPNVKYVGYRDKQEIYNSISDVYHYAKHESWGYIKAECKQLGIPYHSDTEQNIEIWDTEQILNCWKGILDA